MVIPDGMGDYPIEEIGGKTPLEAAHTPFMDELSWNGKIGRCQTVPQGYYPGSDVCILSLLGYDPVKFYSGRAPLEAASLGISMKEDDLVLRCNLIHLTEDMRIADHCAGHITTEEAKEIIQTLSEELGNEVIQFFPGVSYRHITRWSSKPDFEAETTPPHDVPGEPMEKHLPKGKDAELLIQMIKKSRDILRHHPVNLKREAAGKPAANCIWFWGAGYKPKLTNFSDTFGLKGAVISAVDLIKGLGSILKLKEIKVPGITGYFDTDYKAKGSYAVEAIKEFDWILVHVEAPDEAGHSGNLHEKILSIERIDKFILGPLVNHLKALGEEFRLLVTPDHYTPVSKKTHVNHPVPFLLYGSGIDKEDILYSEKNAEKSGLFIKDGHKLMPYFLKLDSRCLE